MCAFMGLSKAFDTLWRVGKAGAISKSKRKIKKIISKKNEYVLSKNVSPKKHLLPTKNFFFNIL